MSTASVKKNKSDSQQACEDLMRFISDFSMLMEKHVEMITKTLQRSTDCLYDGSTAIQLSSQSNILRADQFDLKNPDSKKFQPMRARDFDPIFKDPVSLARPVSESMAAHMAGLQVLDASVSRFLASVAVLRSVDDISRQRLEKTAIALKAMNEAMSDVLVQYRLHGVLTDEFVAVFQRKLLSAMVGSPVIRDKRTVFNEFLRR